MTVETTEAIEATEIVEATEAIETVEVMETAEIVKTARAEITRIKESEGKVGIGALIRLEVCPLVKWTIGYLLQDDGLFVDSNDDELSELAHCLATLDDDKIDEIVAALK